MIQCFFLMGPGHGDRFTLSLNDHETTAPPVTETEGCLEVDVGWYYTVLGEHNEPIPHRIQWTKGAFTWMFDLY